MSTARILVVDDEADIRDLVQEILTEEGYAVDVAANAAEARTACAKQPPDLVLLDIWMPDTDGISLLREWQQNHALTAPVVMMSGHGTVETAVEATRLGAVDYVEKPLSLAKLLRTVKSALEEGQRRRQAARTLAPPLVAPVGRSRLMRDLREQAKHLAPHEAPVLILGEPGTGREAFARYLHSLSPRATGAFVTVVAGSLTEGNLETMLYGSEADGVVQKGLIEKAEQGVLFISELGDLSSNAQRLLLAAFDTGSFSRVGGTAPVRCDARLISSAQPGFESGGRDPFRVDLLAAQRADSAHPATPRVHRGCAGPAALLRGPTGGRPAAAVPAFRGRGAEPSAQLPVAGEYPRTQEPGASPAHPGRSRGNPAR
jgi:DNA-binding NtrC family response regulator